MPSQRNGVYFDATGHDDPRRTDLESLMRRPEGSGALAVRATDRSQRPGVEVRRAARAALLGSVARSAQQRRPQVRCCWPRNLCGWGDLNPTSGGHRNLNPARLPIPPPAIRPQPSAVLAAA